MKSAILIIVLFLATFPGIAVGRQELFEGTTNDSSSTVEEKILHNHLMREMHESLTNNRDDDLLHDSDLMSLEPFDDQDFSRSWLIPKDQFDSKNENGLGEENSRHLNHISGLWKREYSIPGDGEQRKKPGLHISDNPNAMGNPFLKFQRREDGSEADGTDVSCNTKSLNYFELSHLGQTFTFDNGYGGNSYPDSTSCAWVFRVTNEQLAKQSILKLEITNVAVECSFDYILVMSNLTGKSTSYTEMIDDQSNLVAALTGQRRITFGTSKSNHTDTFYEKGIVAVVFQSDESVNYSGFRNMKVTLIPGCGGNNSTPCSDIGRGSCSFQDDGAESQCSCNPGYTGYICEKETEFFHDTGEPVPSRFLASSAYNKIKDSWYFWGGRSSMPTKLDEFIEYSFETSTWRKISFNQSDANPPSKKDFKERVYSAMVSHEKTLYLAMLNYDSSSGSGREIPQLYSFNLESSSWRRLKSPPFPAQTITLNVVRDELILICLNDYDSSAIYHYEIRSDTWIPATTLEILDVSMEGVYEPITDTIYYHPISSIYSSDFSKWMMMSYHVASRTFSFPLEPVSPIYLRLHSPPVLISTDDSLRIVWVGGILEPYTSSIPELTNQCFYNDVTVFDISCQTIQQIGGLPGLNSIIPHSMGHSILERQGKIYIYGGYDGRAMGSLKSFSLELINITKKATSAREQCQRTKWCNDFQCSACTKKPYCQLCSKGQCFYNLEARPLSSIENVDSSGSKRSPCNGNYACPEKIVLPVDTQVTTSIDVDPLASKDISFYVKNTRVEILVNLDLVASSQDFGAMEVWLLNPSYKDIRGNVSQSVRVSLAADSRRFPGYYVIRITSYFPRKIKVMALVKTKSTTGNGGFEVADLPMMFMLVLSLVVMLATAILSYRRYRMQMQLIRAMLEASRPEPQAPNVFAQIISPLFKIHLKSTKQRFQDDAIQNTAKMTLDPLQATEKGDFETESIMQQPVSCELLRVSSSEYREKGLRKSGSDEKQQEDRYYAVNYLIVFPDSTMELDDDDNKIYEEGSNGYTKCIPPSIAFATRLCCHRRREGQDISSFDNKAFGNDNLQYYKQRQPDSRHARMEEARNRALALLHGSSAGTLTERIRNYLGMEQGRIQLREDQSVAEANRPISNNRNIIRGSGNNTSVSVPLHQIRHQD